MIRKDHFTITNDHGVTDRLCQLAWRDAIVGDYEPLVSLSEPMARELVAKLTAWLDAPRMAARKTPTVVAEHGEFRLLRTPYEWGVMCQGEGYDNDDGVAWHADESDARADFREYADVISCELCDRLVEYEATDCDDEGTTTCRDTAACSAARAAKESAK